MSRETCPHEVADVALMGGMGSHSQGAALETMAVVLDLGCPFMSPPKHQALALVNL